MSLILSVRSSTIEVPKKNYDNDTHYSLEAPHGGDSWELQQLNDNKTIVNFSDDFLKFYCTLHFSRTTDERKQIES